MRHPDCLAFLVLSLACGRGAARPDQSSPPPPHHSDSSSGQSRAPRASADSVPGFRIAAVEGHLYSDSTPVSPNIIDNARASLFNVAQLRLRITVTVKWAPREKRAARLSLWARVNGKGVFAQDVNFVPSPDSTARVQDFWLDHGDCDGMLIRAYVAAGGPTESEAFRYIPYECAD
jgi:hypothetical protein